MYLDDLQRGHYQIPTFQREVVWDRDRVKRLWDSIYKFYPLGSILVWRTETKLQKHREIGGHPLRDDPAGREFQYLLDGQQRTTALLTSMYRSKVEDDSDRRLFVDLTVEGEDEVEDETWRWMYEEWLSIGCVAYVLEPREPSDWGSSSGPRLSHRECRKGIYKSKVAPSRATMLVENKSTIVSVRVMA